MFSPDIMPSDIKNICEKAAIEGQKIDLTNCIYESYDGSKFCTPNYYYFLAGFVRFQKLTHILEIGTQFGGSIMSMSRGLCRHDVSKSRIVTIDVTHRNEKGFKEYPDIRRIQGNSLNKEVVEQVVESFDRAIDLIFIDSTHEYKYIKRTIDIYARKLNPKFIILDDIHLNDSMRRLWCKLVGEFKDNAFDASEISKRKASVGFGIIICQ